MQQGGASHLGYSAFRPLTAPVGPPSNGKVYAQGESCHRRSLTDSRSRLRISPVRDLRLTGEDDRGAGMPRGRFPEPE